MTQEKIDELIPRLYKYMREDLMRADITLRNIKFNWYELKRYMESHHIPLFNRQVCTDFILKRVGSLDYTNLSKPKRKIFRAITDLADFMEFGCIHRERYKRCFDFTGEIGSFMLLYFERMKTDRISEAAIKNHRFYLFNFLTYLTEKHVKTICEISEFHIFDHIRNLNPNKPSLPHHTTTAMKGFFRYLHSQNIIDKDYARIIPKCRRVKQPLLPSVYTTDEIQRVLNTIDRSTAIGKRDYAIVLLTAKLGLRSSDVYNLKFENIKWERSKIELTQLKTKEKLELPLLPEVGNAIIEYLQYSRPRKSTPFIFLSGQSPCVPMTASSMRHCVSKCYTNAGVNTYKRKRGPHSLRHSMAKAMLDKNVILPVISEVLGHSSVDSTRYYLRVDTNTMRQCVIEVPLSSMDFYEQNNLLFYGK